MKVVKKLNNNTAICLDDNGEQLVAFGKGIGFPSVPYELHDLSKITMTFYKLEMQYVQLLKDIPSEIFDISAQIVKEAQRLIPKTLNPNLVFSLADHISFTLTRLENYQEVQLPFSYDVEQFYPLETQIGEGAIVLIEKRLSVHLPPSEASAIALHLVNSQSKPTKQQATLNDDDLIRHVKKIIEQEFDLTLSTKEFNYNRLVIHLCYYLKRIREKNQISDYNNTAVFDTMKKEEPAFYLGAKRIADYIDEQLQTQSTQDELFYLMIYVKRIVMKEKESNNGKEK